MIFKDKEYNTAGQIMDYLTKAETRQQAIEFMREYRKTTTHADENVRYMSGYYDNNTSRRLFDWLSL